MEFFKKLSGLFQRPRRDNSLGRNEDCWCGSGKKYKRCHLNLDINRLRGRQNNCTTS